MHIWRKPSLRTLFNGAFLLALILGSGMSVPAANAASTVTLSDGFEANPASRWWFDSGGYMGDGGFFSNTSTGTVAWIETINGWASVGRTINLPITAPYANWSCYTSIWVKPNLYSDPTVVNFEVIDPTTWTYIKLGTFARSSTGGFHLISMNFVPTRKDMVVRLAVTITSPYYDHRTVQVDNLYVSCHN